MAYYSKLLTRASNTIGVSCIDDWVNSWEFAKEGERVFVSSLNLINILQHDFINDQLLTSDDESPAHIVLASKKLKFN